jgi:hypothetical protein
MKESTVYFKWLSILCVGMALFCVGVFIIGYKDLSFGRVATALGLLGLSGFFAFLSKRQSR